MRISTALGAAFLSVGLAASPPAGALSVGMIDTFQDGSTAGWTDGPFNPAPAVNVPDGGPLGAGDRYLAISSSGSPGGAGGKLVAINAAQWADDYIAAGVTSIRMDLNNLGATDLRLRLLFEAPLLPRAWSIDAVTLPAGSGWRQVAFSIDPSALTGLSPATSLADVVQLRLYHGVAPLFPGEDIAAQLGIDNIAAVPEPGTWAMLGIGLAVVLIRHRRRKSDETCP